MTTFDPSPTMVDLPDWAVRQRRFELRYQLVWLVLALVVLVMAALMAIRDDRQVLVPGMQGPLPEICAWRRNLGIDCPGCGLTRCFISLAHGDVVRAWSFNPAGLLLFGCVLFQIPYRIGQWWRIYTGADPWRLAGAEWTAVVVALAIVTQWVYRLLA